MDLRDLRGLAWFYDGIDIAKKGVFGLSRGCMMSLVTTTKDTEREPNMWVWASFETFQKGNWVGRWTHIKGSIKEWSKVEKYLHVIFPQFLKSHRCSEIT